MKVPGQVSRFTGVRDIRAISRRHHRAVDTRFSNDYRIEYISLQFTVY